jgi:DNA-binding NarL/FixJ family response regulator
VLLNNAVTVLVVDDFAPFRRVVGEVLQAYVGIEVVGEAETPADAVRMAESLKPRIVLVDIDFPGESGFAAAPRILAASPQSKIIFVSLSYSIEVIREALRLGDAYVSKYMVVAHLLPAIRAVLGGGRYHVAPTDRMPE